MREAVEPTLAAGIALVAEQQKNNHEIFAKRQKYPHRMTRVLPLAVARANEKGSKNV